MREAGALSTEGVARKLQHTTCVVFCACPPGIVMFAPRQSPHALDVDWNPIRKHKEAGAPYGWSDGSPDPVIQRSGRNGGGKPRPDYSDYLI
jgi:hypothetical protein